MGVEETIKLNLSDHEVNLYEKVLELQDTNKTLIQENIEYKNKLNNQNELIKNMQNLLLFSHN